MIIYKSNKVTRYEVYGTLRCPYTVKMLQHLDEIKQPYVYHDVNEQRKLFEGTKKRLGVKEKGVPFVVDTLNSTYFIGYKKLS